MAGKPQLSASDVERGLKALGFKRQPQKATSHVQWKHTDIGGKLRKVTVDAHHEPFSPDLVKSMANQAGIPVNKFYELCTKGGSKAAKKSPMSWLKDALSGR